ncbi:MAG: Protein phosphatase methylesterase 1 [Vezdaea aestivalis]|nr:MAG: Protein phosphatase methylesterase 1 [Vezdaea aestivalis]
MLEEIGEAESEGRTESRDLENDDDSSISSASSAGTIKPLSTKSLFSRPSGTQGRSYSQTSWTSYFAQEIYLQNDKVSPAITHHAYLTPPKNSGPLFVMHHGAGSSGLSFAVCSSEIRKQLPNAGVMSLDARGHGATAIRVEDNQAEKEPVDMSLPVLSRDLVDSLQLLQERLLWLKLPDLILVGHSLGGAVVTDVAKSGALGGSVLAFAVLDVVEGSVIDALQSMQTYLSTRPCSFKTLSNGIEWHLRTRTVRDLKSACVSVPGLLQSVPSGAWTWRTDLGATEPFWEGWFVGLSFKFLSARGAKLLLLAGTDRLDKELMIGQMQGKYQLQVIPEAGHFIHEDTPYKAASILVDFYRRNDGSTLVLPPKVGDLLKHKQEVGAFAK